MPESIIAVSNLSKEYIISHQPSYGTLRDSLTDFAGRIFRRKQKPNREIFQALRGINFSIKPGERVGIIGKNGAGKSTLLKILSQITPPTSGTIVLHGRVASLLEVGTGFHPELTGRENIFLNGAILGMRKVEIQNKFDEIVKFSEIEKFLDTPVKRYSSGMYLRLAFAVAAHLDPEILIIDEVLAVGDIQFQKKCIGKMQDTAEKGKTILFVSHNLSAIRTLCDRVILLNDGEILADGNPDEVIRAYLGNYSENVLRKEWPNVDTAPGNHLVRAKSIAIVPQFKHGEDMITVDTPLQVEFTFAALQEKLHINTSMTVMEINGIAAFNSFSEQQQLPKGTITFTTTIPAHLLNDTTYSIIFMLVNNGVVQILLPNILSFEVKDLLRSHGYFEKIGGIVRPKLNWQYSVSTEQQIQSK